MEFEYCALTDIGRLRERNEDTVAVDPSNGIAMLADGMGGYSAGEVASALAVERVHGELLVRLQVLPTRRLDAVQKALKIAVSAANRTIRERASVDPDCAGMGTTMVAAVLQDDHAVIGHVGDSRAYLWRDNGLTQLTRDHSWTEELRDLGLGDTAIAASYSNLVTRALGVEEPVHPDICVLELMIGDRILLCSDGLSNMLDDESIAKILRQPLALALQGQTLIDTANARGGNDNISVVLVRVVGA